MDGEQGKGVQKPDTMAAPNSWEQPAAEDQQAAVSCFTDRQVHQFSFFIANPAARTAASTSFCA